MRILFWALAAAGLFAAVGFGWDIACERWPSLPKTASNVAWYVFGVGLFFGGFFLGEEDLTGWLGAIAGLFVGMYWQVSKESRDYKERLERLQATLAEEKRLTTPSGQ